MRHVVREVVVLKDAVRVGVHEPGRVRHEEIREVPRDLPPDRARMPSGFGKNDCRFAGALEL